MSRSSLKSFLAVPGLAALMALSAALPGLAGCRNTQNEFQEAVENYHSALQDRNIDLAGMAVADDERTRFFMDMEKWMKSRQISNYFVRRAVYNADKTQATVTVVREYFDQDQMVVKNETLVQLWEKRGRAWVLLKGDF